MRIENVTAVNLAQGRRLIFGHEFVEVYQMYGNKGWKITVPLDAAWSALAENSATCIDGTPAHEEPPRLEAGLVRIVLEDDDSESLHPVAGFRDFLIYDEFIEVRMSDESEVSTWRHGHDDAWTVLWRWKRRHQGRDKPASDESPGGENGAVSH
jgi:hypothetical protein